MTSDNQVLLFMHMPKAGGATFRDVLKRQYPSGTTMDIESRAIQPTLNIFKTLPDENKQNIRCIMGHMGFGIHAFLPAGVPYTYLTIIRDPVKRTLSMYNFIISRPNHPLYKIIRGMSFAEFVRSDVTPELNDGQTRIIATGECTDLAMSDRTRVTEEDYARAEQRLDEHFGFVGILEEYDSCVMILKQIMGWQDVRYFAKHVSKKKPGSMRERISDEILTEVTRLNPYDMRLHEYARRRFEQALSEYRGDIQADIAAFHEENRRYNLYRAPLLKASYYTRSAFKFLRNLAGRL